MIAVDTNVLVRYLAGDDDAQRTRVLRLFEEELLFVPVTVLLEAEWVLRAIYRLRPNRIMKGFEALAGVQTVTLQSRQEVLRAIAWCSGGLDFADALHLATAREATRLLTLDRAFIKRSKGLSSVDVAAL